LEFVAATLTTLSFLPQVVRTWRTQSADDLSIAMLLAFGTGVLLWLAYGIATHAMPIIVANAITLALTITQLVLTAKYRRHRKFARPNSNRSRA
jgi:MtN3 and saliva related transmembrane protein